MTAALAQRRQPEVELETTRALLAAAEQREVITRGVYFSLNNFGESLRGIHRSVLALVHTMDQGRRSVLQASSESDVKRQALQSISRNLRAMFDHINGAAANAERLSRRSAPPARRRKSPS